MEFIFSCLRWLPRVFTGTLAIERELEKETASLFHLLTVGTTPKVLPSVTRLSSFLSYYLHMIFSDVICSDYLLSILFHCNLVGSSSWIRSFVRWELHDQRFLKCANPLFGKFLQGNMLERRNWNIYSEKKITVPSNSQKGLSFVLLIKE